MITKNPHEYNNNNISRRAKYNQNSQILRPKQRDKKAYQHKWMENYGQEEKYR